jgi:hypothetical protein
VISRRPTCPVWIARRVALRRTISLIAGALSFVVFPAAAAPQTLLSTRAVEVRFQNYMLRGAILRDGLRWNEGFSSGYVQRNTSIPPAGSYLSAYATGTPGLQRYEVSQFRCIVEGAEMGASLGLFVGALGNALGAWDEGKTWLLMGAMSAMGAAVGASKADDPAWSVRFRWEE